MQITIFTSNQPRHIALVDKFVDAGFDVNVVCEATTIRPGTVSDLYDSSTLNEQYFTKVRESERYFFGEIRSFGKIKNLMSLRVGDVNFLTPEQLFDFINSDHYVVFGASYIKGWLCNHLVEKKAINLHMGMSPYYRGSSCNFWACYDRNFEYVGSTLHLLSKGLDSGPIVGLQSGDPKYLGNDFKYTMSAVQTGQMALVEAIKFNYASNSYQINQNKDLEIRYSRMSDFTHSCLHEYLRRSPSKVSLDDHKQRVNELIRKVMQWK